MKNTNTFLQKTKFAYLLLFTLLTITLGSCSAVKKAGIQQATFDQHSLDNTIRLKEKSLELINTSTETYDKHLAEAETLKKELQETANYEKNRKNNNETARQWQIMADPERNMMGKFLTLWQKQGKCSSVFISEFYKNVEQGYNAIIDLEKGKKGGTTAP